MRTILGNVIAIFRKELQGYLASPLAYIIATLFWLLAGYFFVTLLLGPGGVLQRAAQLEQQGANAPAVDVASQFLTTFLRQLGGLILFVLPVLSMGTYTEERKRGTLELLATSPVTNWAVALGKLLGAIAFFTVMVLPLFAYQAVVLSGAEPPLPWHIPLLANAALILLAAAILSLGLFVSSLTSSTTLAAIGTFALVLLLWVADSIAQNVGGPLGDLLSHLSLLQHYQDLVQGVVSAGSIAMLVSYILLGLFLTAQSIDILRFARR